MSVERRLKEAVRIQTEAAAVPSVDVAAIREQARRQARARSRIAVAAAAAAAAAVIVGTMAGVALTQRTDPPTDSPSGPARVNGDGVRAFLDPDAGVLHLGDRSIALARVPGLAETGLAVRGGVLYQTPDQEVRLIDPSGHETVLAPALGGPPKGFSPSVAYDAEADVAVALRLTTESLAARRPLIAAYAASTGKTLASTPMIPMGDATGVTLAGATAGIAAVNFQGEFWTGVLPWTWLIPHRGTEWGAGRVFDMRSRMVLGSGSRGGLEHPPPVLAQLDLPETGWHYVEGLEGERLDPTGQWRVNSTWQTWPEGGPVERSTSGEDAVALPELPQGSRISLSYDTDGSVMAAVANPTGSQAAVLMFDCDLDAQVCEPIGRITEPTQSPLFLDGTRP